MNGTESLYSLFCRTLQGSYIELAEEKASYRAERRGDVLYLFFEKSNGAADWRNNLDFPAKPYRETEERWYVHRGFLRVFKAIEPQIAPMICDKKLRRIVLSGYSHGAALALLCHEYCVFHRPDLARQIFGFGFGCPRVVFGKCGKKLAARFENFSVIRCGKDLVTHLPPALFGYRHVGRMIKVGKGLRRGPVAAHRPESYLSALKPQKGEKDP